MAADPLFLRLGSDHGIHGIHGKKPAVSVSSVLSVVRLRGSCALAWLVLGGVALGEDVVIARSASDPNARVRRTGQIIEYTGDELKLRTPLGRDEIIPTPRIVEIQTEWTTAHAEGRAARLAGKLTEAITAFQRAKSDEPRLWAQRQIAAELAGTLLEAGQVGRAGEQFLAIVAADPATVHYDQVPISWQGVTLDAASETRASAWLADDKSPAARLLGASWLVGSSRQAEVEAALKALAESRDRRLAALARVQLWRVRLPTASTGDLEQWSRELAELPRELQAAGWYVVGDGYARHDEPERAAIAYLKPPLVFREQRALAADGLLAAAGQLAKLGRTEQAAGRYREIVRDFGHLPVAEEARQALSAR